MRKGIVLRRANRRSLLTIAIGALAMAAAAAAHAQPLPAQPSAPSQSPSAQPPGGMPGAAPQSPQPPLGPNQITLYRSEFEQKLKDCHDLALEQIHEKQIDALTQKQNADVDCGGGNDQTCLAKSKATYTATMNSLQKQRNDADGVYAKEISQLAYYFQSNTCGSVDTSGCSAEVKQLFAKPVAQWSCDALANLLNPNTQ